MKWVGRLALGLLTLGACDQQEPSGDICAEAREHVQSCLPDQDIPADTCDPAAAEEVLALNCEQLGEGGKADSLLCTPWTWFFCSGPADTLADDQVHPSNVSVDDEHVYWIESGENPDSQGSLKRVPREGGDSEVLFELVRGEHVFVDATHVYWWERHESGSFADQRLLRISKEGGDPVVLDEDARPYIRQVSVAAGSGGVFFNNSPRDPEAPGRGIKRVDQATGDVTLFVETTDLVRDLTVEGRWLYWLEEHGAPDDPQSSIRGAAGALRRVDLEDDAQPETLLETSELEELAVRDGVVFALRGQDLVRIEGGAVAVLATSPGENPDGLVAGEQSLYWISSKEDTIYSSSLEGGEVTELATGEENPVSLSYTPTALFWSNDGLTYNYEYYRDGEIKRLSL